MLSGLALIALAAVSWGTTGATMTLLARTTAVDPLLVGWARLAIAAPCLIAAAALEPGRRAGGPAGLLDSSAWRARNLGPLLLTGLAMAGYQACYFWAVTLTGVAVAALIAICAAPIMIALLAAAVLGERLTPVVLACLAMAVTGTALLVVGPRGLAEISGHFGLGALLAVGAGLCYAVYTVAAKDLLTRIRPLAVAAGTFTLGALFLSPALARGGGAVIPGAAFPLLLYLGIGPTALAYALFSAGLGRVPATVAGIVTLLEPLTATALGVLVFGESLGALGGAGALLLLAAVIVLTVPIGRGRRRGSPPG